MKAELLVVLFVGYAFGDRLNDVVDYYETVNCEVTRVPVNVPVFRPQADDDQVVRAKRSADRLIAESDDFSGHSDAISRPLRVRFAAFNRSFDLQLSQVDVNEVFSPDFELVDESGRRSATREDFASAFVRGFDVRDGSSASGVLDGSGQFRGVVVTRDGEYHVEPRGTFFSDSLGGSSVVYRGDALRLNGARRRKRSVVPFCGLSDVQMREKLERFGKIRSIGNASFPNSQTVRHVSAASWALELAREASWARIRRSADTKYRRLEKRVCHLSVTTDVYFWEMVRKRSDIRDDAHARSEIALLVGYLIAEVKRIYEATAFAAFANKQFDEENSLEYSYTGVTFRLQRLKVLTERSTCPNGWQVASINPPGTPISGSSVHCTQNIDVATLLGAFSESEKDRSAVCLAYLFTARDFAGTLGMAYVARAADARNGVCSAALNTGLISFKNYGALQTSAMSALTLAHELGHNFGAEHDEDTPVCAPGSRGHAGGNFIMFYSASTDGAATNNRLFSPCSRDAISRVLHHLVTSPTAGNCLEKDDSAFCGNEQREEGEECDCGAWADCADKCCWPADTEPNYLRCQLRRNGTASQKPASAGAPLDGAVCSPQQGACCLPSCGLRRQGSVCAVESHCAAPSYCDGRNATCPRGAPKPNGIPCSVDPTASRPFSKSCYNGECRRSICHAIANLTECQLEIAESERRKPRNPEQYCFVACAVQPLAVDGVLEDCVSSYEWFVATRAGDMNRLNELALRYPLMNSLLIREANGSGIQVPPGSPCSNGRGYCDVFRKCRVIDVDGPLKYLQKLLFSTDSLIRVANWILSNWWYALLALVGTVIVMGFFVKYCSKHTRSSNPEFTRAVRAANMRERFAHRVSSAYQTLRSRVSRTPRNAHVAPQHNRPRPVPPTQPAPANRRRRDERRRNTDRRSQPPSNSNSRSDSQRDVAVLLDTSAGRPVSLIVTSGPLGDTNFPVGVVYTAPPGLTQNPLARNASDHATPPPAYAEVERERTVAPLAGPSVSSTSGFNQKAKAGSARSRSPPRVGPSASSLPNPASLPPHGRGKRATTAPTHRAPKKK